MNSIAHWIFVFSSFSSTWLVRQNRCFSFPGILNPFPYLSSFAKYMPKLRPSSPSSSSSCSCSSSSPSTVLTQLSAHGHQTWILNLTQTPGQAPFPPPVSLSLAQHWPGLLACCLPSQAVFSTPLMFFLSGI